MMRNFEAILDLKSYDEMEEYLPGGTLIYGLCRYVPRDRVFEVPDP